MGKKFYAIGFSILASALLALSCSTSKISVNRGELEKVDTMAIMNFDRAPGIPREIAVECEEAFRGHFLDAGKRVVERARIRSIIGEVERAQSGLVSNSEEIGRLTGAGALLFGSVTRHGEEVKWVNYNEYVKDPVTGKSIKVQRRKKKKFFTFQVQARLVSTVNGSTILTIANDRPERSYEITDSMTLGRMRGYVLNQMGKDLKKAFEGKE